MSDRPRPAARLACHACDWEGALANSYACPSCGGSLTVNYAALDRVGEWRGAAPGMWRYRSLLPISASAEPVTLGEGGTPLIRAARLSSRDLHFKNETVNPTASFKDRPVSVATSVALELGLPGLICASTGNTAVAVGAYAARAGLPAICVVPHTAPLAKLTQIVVSGARVVRVRGTYSDAYALAEDGATRLGWANLTTTYINPYLLEGDKTIAFELFEQLGGQAPDWVLAPVGAGPLLAAVDKGFEELARLGALTGATPRMVAVQAAGCAPIVQAFEAGAEEVSAWDEAITTRASSIADPLHGYAGDGTRTLAAVRRSGGRAVAVSEEEIHEAMISLARSEGLFVEPGSASVVAAQERMVRDGAIQPGDTVVLLLTGHGLKDLEALSRGGAASGLDDAPVLEAGDTEGLAAILDRAAR